MKFYSWKHYIYSKCQDLYLVLLKVESEAVIYHKVQVIDKNDELAKAGESHSPEHGLAGSFPQVAVLSGSQLWSGSEPSAWCPSKYSVGCYLEKQHL